MHLTMSLSGYGCIASLLTLLVPRVLSKNKKVPSKKTEIFDLLKTCRRSFLKRLLKRQTARFGLKINRKVECTYSFALETAGNTLKFAFLGCRINFYA